MALGGVRAWGSATIVAVCAVACGGGTTETGGDAGAGVSDGGASGARPPEIPWLAAGEPPLVRPAITCPAGWRALHPIDGEPEVTTCDPWPETGRATCSAIDEAHFAGEPGCVRIGPACPVGDWATDLPTDRPIRYVNAGAAAGGDGTMARPYNRIASARTGASVGTVIALAKGRYDELVSLGQGVALWGACVAETVLTSSVPNDTDGVVTSTGRDAELRNVRIDNPARPGVTLFTASSSMTLDSVVITGAVSVGLRARFGATLTARAIVIRDIRLGSTSPTALLVSGGSRADVSRAAIGAEVPAIVASGDGSVAHVTDVAMIDVTTVAPMIPRVHAQGGGTVQLERFTLEGRPDTQGLSANGGHLEITDGIASGPPVVVLLAGGGTCDARRVRITHTQTGFDIQHATATLEDLVIDDVTTQKSGRGGHAVFCAGDDATLAVRRLAVTGVAGAVLLATSACTATAEDVLAVDPAASLGSLAFGIAAKTGGSLTATRVIMRERSGTPFDAVGAFVSVSDFLATGGPLGECGSVGAVALDDGELVLARGIIARAPQVGLAAATAVLRASDVIVSDIAPCDARGIGRGLFAQANGSIEATRVRVDRSREIAAGAIEGGALTLRDITLTDTAVASCTLPVGCDELTFGSAIVAVYGGRVSVSGFVVAGAAQCGVHVADTAGLDVSDGEVSRSAIGACVQSDGYDVTRLTTGVRYYDNGVNLQATSLPLPTALDFGTVTP